MSSARGGGNGAGQEQAVARHEAATSKVAQASVRAFWTPARMQAATPRELADPQAKKGKPGGSTSSSSKAVKVNPQPELGKVFFTLGGSDYVCSGTAATSANRDVVTTAGHCLNEGPGRYATNFAFVPAYDNGARPLRHLGRRDPVRAQLLGQQRRLQPRRGLRRHGRAGQSEPDRRGRLLPDRLQQGLRPELRRLRLPRRQALQRAGPVEVLRRGRP